MQYLAMCVYVYTISCTLCIQYLLHVRKKGMCCWVLYTSRDRANNINKMVNVLIPLVACDHFSFLGKHVANLLYQKLNKLYCSDKKEQHAKETCTVL